VRLTPALATASLLGVGLSLAAQPVPLRGVQDPAWSPDGRRIAFSYLDQIWTAAPDGRNGRHLRPRASAVERDPAWSPDGKTIAFAADHGDRFDIYTTALDGGSARRITEGSGDDRWPSWTRDGRVVFSRRDGGRWRLFAIAATGGEAAPLFSDTHPDEDEREGRVSPDGKRIAYVSDRDSEDGEVDVWIADLPPGSRPARRTRVAPARGVEGYPAWSPDGRRVAFYAVREGRGSVWVASAAVTGAADDVRARPAEQPVLASRHGGVPAWSPDGRRIAIADIPQPDPTYNGNPLRSIDQPPPLFADDAFRLWMVDAPVPVDAGARTIAGPGAPESTRLVAAFDRVWETLRRLYYSDRASEQAWRELKDKHRPAAVAARDEAALEDAVDALIAQ
jgi:dipeptidyl aminopeptidase/acylaminoacyl peptidase